MTEVDGRAMRLTRSHLLLGIACGAIGIVLGIGIGVHVSTRTADNFSVATEARYGRAMFCFAPPDVALPAAETYLRRISTTDGDELLQRDRVFAATAVALLRQRLNSSDTEAAWVAAQKVCGLTEYRDCSREWLARLLTSVCTHANKT